LALPLTAPEQLPAFANSAMDGYAVQADDVAGAGPNTPSVLPVVADIPAGAPIGQLEPGTAHRIMTGAAVPVGADAIVEVEATDGGTTMVEIRAARDPGTFVRSAGSDVAAGTQVLDAGMVLGPAQIGLLAALGVGHVDVRRRPRVLVCSTGSELAEHPARGSGLIRDANAPMLMAAVHEAGGVAVPSLWVEDDVPSFLAAIGAAVEGAGGVDLVITSGGVSAGAYEVVKDALGPLGVEFRKVAIQPGMPQGSGLVTLPNGTTVPVVCLPGNPVSALVSFEVFIRPALRSAAGLLPAGRPVVTATLADGVSSIAGKRQFRRARLDRLTGVVTPWGPAGSVFLGWFAGADCLIDVPTNVADMAPGDLVDVWDLTRSS
ncbi:MAG: molybdopterin molybdotransferase MoeA, partial [Nocardioides sp.]|nr:molybdopterin molybdotransferase MoeA [Nocardioides sp.]